MTEVRTVTTFTFVLAKYLKTGQKLVDKNALVEKVEVKGSWVTLHLHYLSTDWHGEIRVRTSKSFEIE